MVCESFPLIKWRPAGRRKRAQSRGNPSLDTTTHLRHHTLSSTRHCRASANCAVFAPCTATEAFWSGKETLRASLFQVRLHDVYTIQRLKEIGSVDPNPFMETCSFPYTCKNEDACCGMRDTATCHLRRCAAWCSSRSRNFPKPCSRDFWQWKVYRRHLDPIPPTSIGDVDCSKQGCMERCRTSNRLAHPVNRSFLVDSFSSRLCRSLLTALITGIVTRPQLTEKAIGALRRCAHDI